jgi:crotonobetaine/carnitine-CoA ligase
MTSAIYAQPPCDEETRHAVRFVVSAGMPQSLWRRFEQRFGLRVLEFWGTAEGGIAVNPVGAGPVGSCGKPVPTLQHRIVDEADKPVEAGQCGELQIRHSDGRPYVVEYYSEPEASRRKCEGGWMRSGDIVHEDTEGWLFFHYRRGSEIRRDGEFVSPAVIERAIAETRMAADVYVYGVHSETGVPGEKQVVAAVVPAGPRFHESALRDELRLRLESSQMPDLIQVVQEIPKTASEKPQDRFLIDQLTKTSQKDSA